MDILGAVSAGVALAQLCYDFQQRLRQLPADTRLLKTLVKECDDLAKQINSQVLLLPAEVRSAAQMLSDRVSEIAKEINQLRNRSFLIKLTSILQLRGKEYKEKLTNLLTDFQVQAVLAANQVLQEIRGRVGQDGIPADIQRKLEPLVGSLTRLQQNHDGLRERLETLRSLNDEVRSTGQQTFVLVGDIHVEVARNRQDTASALSQIMDLRKELESIQSKLPAIGELYEPTPKNRLDRVEISAPLSVHLEHLNIPGSTPTEGEIYEILRDCVRGYLSLLHNGFRCPLWSVHQIFGWGLKHSFPWLTFRRRYCISGTRRNRWVIDVGRSFIKAND